MRLLSPPRSGASILISEIRFFIHSTLHSLLFYPSAFIMRSLFYPTVALATALLIIPHVAAEFTTLHHRKYLEPRAPQVAPSSPAAPGPPTTVIITPAPSSSAPIATPPQTTSPATVVTVPPSSVPAPPPSSGVGGPPPPPPLSSPTPPASPLPLTTLTSTVVPNQTPTVPRPVPTSTLTVGVPPPPPPPGSSLPTPTPTSSGAPSSQSPFALQAVQPGTNSGLSQPGVGPSGPDPVFGDIGRLYAGNNATCNQTFVLVGNTMFLVSPQPAQFVVSQNGAVGQVPVSPPPGGGVGGGGSGGQQAASVLEGFAHAYGWTSSPPPPPSQPSPPSPPFHSPGGPSPGAPAPGAPSAPVPSGFQSATSWGLSPNGHLTFNGSESFAACPAQGQNAGRFVLLVGGVPGGCQSLQATVRQATSGDVCGATQ